MTRARTSATRNAEIRPGRSWVSATEVVAIVRTPTSIGPAGAGGAAGGPWVFFSQAARQSANAISEWAKIRFIVIGFSSS